MFQSIVYTLIVQTWQERLTTNIDPDKLLKCEDKFEFVLEKSELCDEESDIKQEAVAAGLDTSVEDSDPDDDFDEAVIVEETDDPDYFPGASVSG